jgi:hypothetical protein
MAKCYQGYLAPSAFTLGMAARSTVYGTGAGGGCKVCVSILLPTPESGWGQNENSPFSGLCQLWPAADMRPYRLMTG